MVWQRTLATVLSGLWVMAWGLYESGFSSLFYGSFIRWDLQRLEAGLACWAIFYVSNCSWTILWCGRVQYLTISCCRESAAVRGCHCHWGWGKLWYMIWEYDIWQRISTWMLRAKVCSKMINIQLQFIYFSGIKNCSFGTLVARL